MHPEVTVASRAASRLAIVDGVILDELKSSVKIVHHAHVENELGWKRRRAAITAKCDDDAGKDTNQDRYARLHVTAEDRWLGVIMMNRRLFV
jgi:hypothetical protein